MPPSTFLSLDIHTTSVLLTASWKLPSAPLFSSTLSSTERSGSEWAGVEWDYSGIEGFDNKIGEQPWPQLVHCASIYCHVCGCIFQEDGIVVRSAGEEWYID